MLEMMGLPSLPEETTAHIAPCSESEIANTRHLHGRGHRRPAHAPREGFLEARDVMPDRHRAALFHNYACRASNNSRQRCAEAASNKALDITYPVTYQYSSA